MRTVSADPTEVRATREAARPREQPPGPESPLTADAVLALQRTGGNRAVQRLLTAPSDRTLARFSDLLVRERAEQVKDWLEAKIQVRAHEIFTATKRTDELANYFEAKKQVEEAWQHLTTLTSGGAITSAQWAVMKLGLSSDEYAVAVALVGSAVKESDWQRAARLLNSMTSDEASQKLASLTDAQIGDVCRKGAAAAAIDLTDLSQPLAAAAKQVMRVSAAEAAFSAAVQKKEWGAAVQILDDLTNEEVKRLVGAMSDEEQPELGDAVMALPRKDRERRYNRLAFLLEGKMPAAETKTGKRDFKITDPGAPQHQGGAGPGTVEMRTGVGIEGDGKSATGWFSLGYSDAAVSADTRWLQFVWRDLEVDYDSGEHEFALSEYKAPSGTWRFSDPGSPQPHVDSLSGSSPFFDAYGLNVRNPDMAAILDAPSRPDSALSNFEDKEAEGKKRTITRMITRAHFVSYLLQGNAVAYRVAFTIEWPWRPDTLGSSTRNVTGAAANALDAPHRSVLERDYAWAAAAIGVPQPVVL